MTLFTTTGRDNRPLLRVNRSPPESQPRARFKRRRAPRVKIRRYAARPPALNRALFAANNAAAAADAPAPAPGAAPAPSAAQAKFLQQ